MPTISSLPLVRRLRALVVVPCLAVCCCTAWGAATVNIDTGKSLSLQPSQSGSIALSFTNIGSESSFMTSYTLALMFVQTSGDGTLTFDLWTGPASNPLLTDPDAEYTPFGQPEPFQLLAPVDVSGTEYFDYFSVQGANSNGADNELAAGVTKNVGVVNLLAGSEPGTWDVYVVNQEPEAGGLPVSFWQLATGDDFGFGNLAALDGAYLLVGSVVVVPEPSSIVLVGCGGLALVASWCRRRATRRDGLRPAPAASTSPCSTRWTRPRSSSNASTRRRPNSAVDSSAWRACRATIISGSPRRSDA